MMSMCPICYELYSNLWSRPCCECGYKTINLSVELIGVVKLLIDRGFIVSGATCTTHDDQIKEGKTTQIRIDFKATYPQALFEELPPDWLLSNYNLAKNGEIYEPKLSMLTCVCRHPPSESDSLSIQFDKMLTIDNFEIWLMDIDPEGCRAILRLYGCL